MGLGAPVPKPQVVQEEGPGAFHVGTVHARLDRDSAFSTCGMTFGAELARNPFLTELRA